MAWLLVAGLLGAVQASAQIAEDDRSTLEVFKKAGQSGKYFEDAYGFAVFPSIGKGGIGIGGARGKGRVYEQGKLIGETTMTQLSAGLQFGHKGFAIFTVAKGGLMYEASLRGQKFKFKPAGE